MNIELAISAIKFRALQEHLFQGRQLYEQAAFMFAKLNRGSEEASFQVLDVDHMSARDFVFQSRYHLELADHARMRVIKRAHDLGCSLIEVHSHPGGLPAEFSPSDLDGLRDTVPNIWWRLKKKPYLALVFAEGGFDALAWMDSPQVALPLTKLTSEDVELRPTDQSLEYWS